MPPARACSTRAAIPECPPHANAGEVFVLAHDGIGHPFHRCPSETPAGRVMRPHPTLAAQSQPLPVSGDSAVTYAAVFLAVVFLAGFGVAVTFLAAHRFFKAATIAALPALLSLRFGFDGSGATGAGGADSPRILAHRRCWASFIRRRAAAENFLRLPVGASDVAAAVGLLPPSSMARSSAI